MSFVLFGMIRTSANERRELPVTEKSPANLRTVWEQQLARLEELCRDTAESRPN